MYCSKCGAVVADGVAFCSACGQPSPAVGAAPVIAPLGIPMGVQVAARAPVVYAGFWLRFVALIIDSIVMWILGAIVLFPLMGAMGITAIFRGMNAANGGQMRPEDMLPFMTLFFRIILISAVLRWLYYALMESSSWQATLGKKALGLEVTDMEGRRIGFGRATGRTFGKIISAFILYIGFLMAAFTEKKQALHDMIAGCLVIKKI
jgi:uncharacterized RDD family membrane protein YckC